MPTEPEVEQQRGSYCDTMTHSEMLRDVVRTSAYLQAITELVNPGSRVIDFGAGTGVLSIFAARRQAGQVDAIERETIVHSARRIAQLNGAPNIRFHHGDHRSFETDGQADVLVSEWMGHCLFFESMLEPLIELRDKWLKPDGVMVPQRVTVSASLMIDQDYYDDLSFLQRSPYGVNFAPIADAPVRQSHLMEAHEEQIMNQSCKLASMDMKTIERTPEVLTGIFTPEREATTFGIVAWFDAELSEHCSFGTGPQDAATHWRQMYFPFPQPLVVHPSRPLTLVVRPPRNVEGRDFTWSWSASDGQTTVSVNERTTIASSVAAS